nr:hypothetical protein [Tanacetum cinerariifolium]
MKSDSTLLCHQQLPSATSGSEQTSGSNLGMCHLPRNVLEVGEVFSVLLKRRCILLSYSTLRVTNNCHYVRAATNAQTLSGVQLDLTPTFVNSAHAPSKGGCCPMFGIYGRDHLLHVDRYPKLLFSTPRKRKLVVLCKGKLLVFCNSPTLCSAKALIEAPSPAAQSTRTTTTTDDVGSKAPSVNVVVHKKCVLFYGDS